MKNSRFLALLMLLIMGVAVVTPSVVRAAETPHDSDSGSDSDDEDSDDDMPPPPPMDDDKFEVKNYKIMFVDDKIPDDSTVQDVLHLIGEVLNRMSNGFGPQAEKNEEQVLRGIIASDTLTVEVVAGGRTKSETMPWKTLQERRNRYTTEYQNLQKFYGKDGLLDKKMSEILGKLQFKFLIRTINKRSDLEKKEMKRDSEFKKKVIAVKIQTPEEKVYDKIIDDLEERRRELLKHEDMTTVPSSITVLTYYDKIEAGVKAKFEKSVVGDLVKGQRSLWRQIDKGQSPRLIQRLYFEKILNFFTDGETYSASNIETSTDNYKDVSLQIKMSEYIITEYINILIAKLQALNPVSKKNLTNEIKSTVERVKQEAQDAGLSITVEKMLERSPLKDVVVSPGQPVAIYQPGQQVATQQPPVVQKKLPLNVSLYKPKNKAAGEYKAVEVLLQKWKGVDSKTLQTSKKIEKHFTEMLIAEPTTNMDFVVQKLNFIIQQPPKNKWDKLKLNCPGWEITRDGTLRKKAQTPDDAPGPDDPLGVNKLIQALKDLKTKLGKPNGLEGTLEEVKAALGKKVGPPKPEKPKQGFKNIRTM